MVQQATSSFAVRTFVTEFKLKKTFLNTTVDNHSSTHEVENEIAHTVSLLKGLLMPVLRFLGRISLRIRRYSGSSVSPRLAFVLRGESVR